MKKLFAFLLVLFAVGIYTDIVPLDDTSANPTHEVIQLAPMDIDEDIPHLDQSKKLHSESLFMRSFILSTTYYPASLQVPIEDKRKHAAQTHITFADLHYDPGSCGLVLV
ncbi:hypothetical protein DN752_17860 [Echinicola strongylocentroti]|uniref:Uncharacterized protein n=1 Tax=Echinicola strongylocentroti TaxID=1795355 RepID=A0A2Z4IMM3_9BACT|nr:hypothetical protein [Echinicola strongylocentroti]AWW31846.1 hypothetical protein DN752_17860 [Echinicola strongylocentroti]